MFEMGNRFDLNTPTEVVERRLEMIHTRIKKVETVEEILNQYDVSRRIFYKFLKRYHEYGKMGLYNISRAPLRHGRETSPQKVNELVGLHQKHPYFSSYELHDIVPIPANTIQRILKKRGLEKSYMPKAQKKNILQKLKREILQRRKQKK